MSSTGSMSNYLEQKLFDHVFRGIPYDTPGRVYVGLFTTDPTDANLAGAEVEGSWYARQDPANGADPSTGFTQTTPGTLVNAKAITFPSVAGVLPTETIHVAYAGVFDAATGGNLLWHGALTLAKDLSLGDILTLPIGNVQFTLD